VVQIWLGHTVTCLHTNSPSRIWTTLYVLRYSRIPCILWNLKVNHHIHENLPPVPILSHINPVHVPHPNSQRSILILSSHLCLCLPRGLLPSGFPTKTLYAPPLSPIRATCPAISVFLTWSPKWWWVRSTEHKALCYAVFSTPLLPHPSWAQISSSALYSWKPSAYFPPSVWVTKFHTHIKQPARLVMVIIF
jgi:hypothetical protein